MTERPTVIVPLDGSSASEQALIHASWFAKATDAEIGVVHAVQASGAALVSANLDFASYGERLCRKYGLDPDRCRFDVLAGSPAHAIVEASAKAACIVMASHGRSGFRATFVGSVADKVVRAASSPVLLVPSVQPAAEVSIPPKTIAVGLDGSREAEAGLGVARGLAERLAARIVLIRAVSNAVPIAMEFGYYPPEVPQILEEEAASYLEETAREGEEAVQPAGDAAAAIVAASSEAGADLVVLSATGKGLAGRLALGSTTDRVMHSLHRPLLIVPAGYAGGQRPGSSPTG